MAHQQRFPQAALHTDRNGEPWQALDEHARARRERAHLLRELEMVHAGARLVRDELDTLRLAQELARHVAHALNAERGLVFLIDNDDAHARAMIEHGRLVAPHRLKALVYGLHDGVTGLVALRQQIVISNDAQADPQFALHRERGLDCRNALCVPVVNHQRCTIAVIEAHNRRDGRLFSGEDIRIANTLATTAATGIERARMFERMHEWAQSLESLLAFNAAINAHLNPQSLIRRLVENAARFLKADGGMAGLAVPQENGETVMIAESYWHLGVWHPFERKWRANEGLPGFMLVSEFPYLTNAYRDDDLRDPELIRRFDIHQALCVPIKNAQDQVLGFFKLHNISDARQFTWQDAGFLESLANMTAVAIENARLIKALEATNGQIQALSAAHLNRLEDERRRISRELHDEAGQALIGVKLALQVMSVRATQHAPELRAELDVLREQVNAATGQLKELARHLRPPTLDELGLVVALRQLCSDVEKRGGLQIHLSLDDLAERLPQPVETALFRIAQEALTNVQKHAGASQVWIALKYEPRRVRLTVRDDGRGFDAKHAGAGLGLLGIRERAELLKGSLRVSAAQGGATLEIEIPLRAD